MSSLQFTAADRDEDGKIKVGAAPRSLADLLPTPASVQAAARPSAQPPRAQLAAFAIAGLLAIGIAVFQLGRAPLTPAARPPERATVIATARITVNPQPKMAARLLTAFAAPGGIELGTIEATRPMTATASYGSDWTQFDVAGSGLVWLHSREVPGMAAEGLPDLRPKRTIAPQEAPVAAPEPTVCARVGTAGAMIERCGTDSLDNLEAAARQEWIARSGATLVTVTTPTPMTYK